MNFMRGKVFLDTNIFVYSIDTSPINAGKSVTARRIIKDRIEDGTGVISVQVIQEFYQVATTKIEVPLSTEEALEYLRYMAVLEVVIADFDFVQAAIKLHKKHHLSFWDGLILQAAKHAACSQCLTEDLQHGLKVDGLTVLNPFHTLA